MAEYDPTVSTRLIEMENRSGSRIVRTFDRKIYFTCRCGIAASVGKYKALHLLCKECIKEELKLASSIRTTRAEVLERLMQEGSGLLAPSEVDWHTVNALTPITLQCACGAVFKRRYSRLFEKDPSGRLRSAKCVSCMWAEKFTAVNHPNWKEGAAQNRKFSVGLTPSDRWWERAIKRQFGYQCIISGVKGRKNIVSHHLDSYGQHEDKRWDTRNGVAITPDLHHEFHCRYDKYSGTCTRIQFAQFFEEKTGRDFETFMETIHYENCPYHLPSEHSVDSRSAHSG